MSSKEDERTLFAKSAPEISESENLQSAQPQSLEEEIKMRVQKNIKAGELSWNLRRLVEQRQRECEMLRREILAETQRPVLWRPKRSKGGSSKKGLTVEMLQGLQKIMKDFENIEKEHSALTLQTQLPVLEREVQTRRGLASDMRAAYEVDLKKYFNRAPPQQSSINTLLQDLRVEKLRVDEERIVKKGELERAWYFAPPSCVMPTLLQ